MKKKLGLLAAFCLVISLLVISGFAAGEVYLIMR